MKIEQLTFKDGAWDKELPDLSNTSILAFAFGAPEYRDTPQPFDDLKTKYPDIAIMGCSTSGEILNSKISDNSVVVALVQFEKTEFRVTAVAVDDCSNATEIGERVAQELISEDIRAVSVLSDGLNVNGTELTGGLNKSLGKNVTVSGGLAADGADFGETWVLVDGKPRSGYVCGVGFYGDNIEISHGSEGGWQPFGPERIITKSEDNVLFELDGKPALGLYKEYLGERAEGLPATALLFPLQVTKDNPFVRTILSVNEEDQSMTFAGDVPEGATARLMRTTEEGLIEGAENAAQQIDPAHDDRTSLTIAISCVGRRLVMGENCEEETEATQDMLGSKNVQIGFYSYGELAPTGFSQCGLHNQTMTLTTLSEK